MLAAKKLVKEFLGLKGDKRYLEEVLRPVYPHIPPPQFVKVPIVFCKKVKHFSACLPFKHWLGNFMVSRVLKVP